MACLVLVVAAALLVPTWVLGGFRIAPLPEAAVGERVAYEEVAVTVRGARLDELEYANVSRRVLSVEVRALNRLDEDVHRFGDLFTVDEPLFTEPTVPAAGLAHEVATGQNLQPRLPRDVILSWRVPARAQVPDEIVLTLHKRTLKRDFGSQAERWLDPEPWLTVRVPVVRE